MDPIRRKLVELRDEVEQTLRYAAERSGGTSSGVKTGTRLLREKIDAILADWDEDLTLCRVTREVRKPFTLDDGGAYEQEEDE